MSETPASPVSADSLLVLTRRRGRPRSAEPKLSVSAWIPVSRYDEIVALAKRRDESVSQVVQRLIGRRISLLNKS